MWILQTALRTADDAPGALSPEGIMPTRGSASGARRRSLARSSSASSRNWVTAPSSLRSSRRGSSSPAQRRDFLDALVALGQLEREDGLPQHTDTALFLDRSKPSYIGGCSRWRTPDLSVLEIAHRRVAYWRTAERSETRPRPLRRDLPKSESPWRISESHDRAKSRRRACDCQEVSLARLSDFADIGTAQGGASGRTRACPFAPHRHRLRSSGRAARTLRHTRLSTVFRAGCRSTRAISSPLRCPRPTC